MGDVIQIIDSLRSCLPLAKGARIALDGMAPIEFIKAVLTLDGIAESILLLPENLDCRTKEALIEEAKCTHYWEATDQQPIVMTKDHKYPDQMGMTQWLLATSGTTGAPKLIEHSLSSLTRALKFNPNKSSEFRWGLMYDPNRFAGLQVVLQSLLGGSTLNLPSGSGFEAQVQALVDHPVNALSATPTLWRKLLMDGRIRQLNLRQITLGGEIADQVILDALKRSFPYARITHIYASTEAGTGFAVNDGLAGFPLDWLVPGRGPIPIRIDKRGHLMVKPLHLPGGEAVRRRLDADGYLDTEDEVSIDVARIVFRGRASGAINVGGNKVNPELVEQILRQIPGVLDAKVYPKKSSLIGQLVAANVVPHPGSDEYALRQQIREQCMTTLEGWQVPAMICFVQALAVTPAGKLERKT